MRRFKLYKDLTHSHCDQVHRYCGLHPSDTEQKIMRPAVLLFTMIVISYQLSVSEARPAIFDTARKIFQNLNIAKEVIKKHGINVATGGLMLYAGAEEIKNADFTLPTKYAYMEKQIKSSWASIVRSLRLIEEAKSGQSRNFVCYIVFIIISLFIIVNTCWGIRNEIYIRPLQ